ncbi:AzlC family ABC transporter permease [Clostridium sp. AM58-1XD]|uniref:AzlC family ABC transporter permease n=1 Tax=Clostridium sp. AM58-1XD TaxID=2292307 RepID=UPI000E535D41|nr:AzlC family ABC transporter permease [Clostridium sp. AM58-1XD]RGZ01808.1 branched-chain amino acid ABC transporter permease [Clostridium sp. AM58-1XD]
MKNKRAAALKYAFPKTVPVMVGYLFLGAAYGILMAVNGFGIGWSVAASLIIYAGSLQYLGVNLLAAGVSPVYGFFMALMINARHLFYGISMLDKYRDVKRFKPYLIFALTDETFSVLCAEEVPEGMEKDWVYLWTALLDQCYWVLGTAVGALMGSMISFNTKGLDFALTALFIVIFTDQWKNKSGHWPAMAGIFVSAASLFLFGKNNFIVPAMIGIIAVLAAGEAFGRKRDSRASGCKNTAETLREENQV